MTRRATLAVVAAVAVVAAGLGWLAGQRITSPAELAAQAEPPTPSLITVAVERRELSTSVIVRGQVEFEDSAEIPVKPSPEGVTIVTQVLKQPGDELAEGEVAVEIAGRPLFVMEGELPVFRTLGPGVQGPDVRQLEAALVRLGHDPGTVDDTYDNATELAVAEFYRGAGYTPKEPTTDELDQLEQARQRVRAANDSLRAARVAASSGGVPESLRLELDLSIRQAEQGLEDATRQRNEVLAPLIADRDAAVAAVASLQADFDVAAARVSQAEQGTNPDTGQPPTRQELDALRAVRDEIGAELAEAAAAQGAADAALAEAEREQNRAVEAASTNLAIARARRAEAFAQSAAEGGGAETIRGAEEEVRSANAALATLDSAIGTSFPSNELHFLPVLPRTVQTVLVETGDFAQGSAMTVTGTGVVIRSTVSAADRPLITEGAEGVMEDSNLGVSVAVRVAFVADSPGGPNAGSDRYAVRLEPIEPVPEDAYNQNLRVTLPFESTDGEVLAVPLAALSAGADGTSRVQVERADGQVDTVTVRTGLLARSVGLVEIEPIDGALDAGDRVIVGRQAGGASDDDSESGSGEEDG